MLFILIQQFYFCHRIYISQQAAHLLQSIKQKNPWTGIIKMIIPKPLAVDQSSDAKINNKLLLNLFCFKQTMQTSYNHGAAFQGTQQSVNSIIAHLDQSVWNKMALKAISKMPKHLITRQTNTMFKDFAFVSTDMFERGGEINQESDKNPGLRQRQLGGFAQLIRKQIRHAVAQVTEQPMKKMPTRRKYQKSQKKQTVKPLTRSVNLSQTKASPFSKLFISDPQNDDQFKKQEHMRSNRHEVTKYNQQMQRMDREHHMLSEQRTTNQQKKLKDSKEFTYDYEGKILTVPINKVQRLKICNIKSHFQNASKDITAKKANLNQKTDSSEKVTTVNNKRVIRDQSKLTFDEQGRSSFDFSRKGRSSFQNNLMDLFKSSRNVQMGVSITDMANHSKIQGQSYAKQQNRLNLTQFKQMKSAFKPRARTLPQTVKKSQSNIVNDVINSSQRTKQQGELFFKSDVSSRLMCSQFSHYIERSGRIRKNEKVYTQNFE